MEPKTPMPAMISQASKGTWTWKAIQQLVEKTSSGRKVLELIDKHGLTVAPSRTAATFYEHDLKTVFISEATHFEDAMNALVHEVEHADWRMTGKSALAGDIATMQKDMFVQRMCREEAAAEAATIKNKYATQTMLDRKVSPAPTEQIYHDAFVGQAQALQGSSLAEAEKIAICQRKGGNAVRGVLQRPNPYPTVGGFDGKPYNQYYGDMWEKMKALAPSPPSSKS